MLAKGLKYNRSVTTLRIDGNLIGDDGIICFVENWLEDSPLVSVDLGRNDFGIVGLTHLLNEVTNRPRIMNRLAIDVCQNLGHLGLQLFAKEILD